MGILSAVALLLPVALGAGAGLATAARTPVEVARGFTLVSLCPRTLPFLGALLVMP